MTIKEMEALCGMTRANIRFYESEGLLTPARNENGYRDYSKENAEVLKRIKLLRTLHISLEEIKALHTGDHELSEVLERQVRLLEDQKEDIVKSQEVCQVMRRDGVCYGTLNAQRYLDVLKRSPELAVPELEADAIPKESAPWRRFWARNLDMTLYSTLWSLFLVGLCNVNLNDRGVAGDLLDAAASIALLVLVEPVLLAFFGTTPGKWIMGIRVTDYEERRLTYSEARNRVLTVLWKGMGLEIPIYSLYRNWKSYQDCQDGRTLEWELDNCITLRDKKSWRTVALVAVHGAIFAILFLGISSAQLPKHRGDITVAQFCENYNRLADYFRMDEKYDLSSTGEWQKMGNDSAVIYIGGYVERPKLTFTEENGVMKGVEFSLAMENSEDWPPSYKEQMMLMALSFVCAQKECNIFSKERNAMLQLVEESLFKSYEFSCFGVDGSCEVEYSGYEDAAVQMGMLWPKEGEKNRYEMKFRLEKNQVN